VAGRMKLGAQALAVGLVAALLALLVWKLVHDEGSGIPSALARGERPPAPLFDLPRLDGEGTLSLTDLRGKAVVVNFWASWCFPCKQESAALERTWREHRNDGLVVVGVNFNDVDSDARSFVEDEGLTYPVVVDRKGSIMGRYGLTGVPETFFVDRQGRLVGSRVAGPVNEGRFREQFEQGVRLALAS
jgi:cytochrome c biogenesis protein CcmG, thiol:disulfide interchange protein DsbE